MPRARLRNAPDAEGVAMFDGVQRGIPARHSKPPPKIRALRMLGADALGMSTVPEVILARFPGLKAAAVSTLTNMAAGLSDKAISHDHSKAMAPIGAAKREYVLRRFLRDME